MSFDMLTIEIPFPPSVNHYWRHVLIGRSVRSMISAKGRAYAKDVCKAVMAQGAARGISKPCRVTVTLFPPDRRRRDADNHGKATLDSLVNAGVIVDDGCSVVRSVTLCWGDVVKGGRAVVRIDEAEAGGDQ